MEQLTPEKRQKNQGATNGHDPDADANKIAAVDAAALKKPDDPNAQSYQARVKGKSATSTALELKQGLTDFWRDLTGKKPYLRYLERENRLRRAAGKIFLLGNVVFGLLYIFWFFSVLNWSVWYVSFPFFLAEIIGLVTATFFATIIWYPRYHRPEGIIWDQTPSVDIFLTTCGEPSNIVERTLNATARIDYPKKTIYILDDANAPAIRSLAERSGCRYIARADHSHAKAGNLNHALSQTDGELILVLDSDQIPDKDIVRPLVNYFKIPDLAFVQSAQRFVLPEGDPFGNSDELFYKVMQPGKDSDNSAFSCGSGVLYRRAALESVGGFSTWNLVEDVHTSMKLHAKGWKSIFHNHPLSTGTAPADIYGVYKQRYQWATDSLRLVFWDSPFKKAGLTLKQKLQYYQVGFIYMVSGFVMPIYFLVPSWSLLTGHFLAHGPVLDYVFYRGLYFLFTLLALVTLERPVDSRKPYKIWAGLFPIFAKATITALRSKHEKPRYAVNKKMPDNPRFIQRFRAIVPQFSIILLTIASITYSYRLETLPAALFIVNTVWGVWVTWSLSGICLAAVKRKKFPADTQSA